MTDRLDEIRKRLNQAGGYLSGTCMSEATMTHAPEDIAYLLGEVERLRAAQTAQDNDT